MYKRKMVVRIVAACNCSSRGNKETYESGIRLRTAVCTSRSIVFHGNVPHILHGTDENSSKIMRLSFISFVLPLGEKILPRLGNEIARSFDCSLTNE